MQILFHLTGIVTLLFCAILCNIYVVHRLINPRFGKRGTIIYMTIHTLSIVTLTAIGCIATFGGLEDSIPTLVWVMYGFMLLYIPKLCYTLISIIDYIKRPRGHWGGHIGFIVAALSFLLIIGSTFNRYRIDTKHVEVTSVRLPECFNGYRIVHFSDLHLETLYSRSYAQRIVDQINELKPDMIVFSGDLVNRKSTELDNYKDILSQLCARDGIYSVMGNHDYGDFVKWPSREAHQANLDRLYRLQTDMGWTLLNNASSYIYRGNDSIAIIGVENWGEPPFQQYGNLEEAYPDLHSDTYKLLISHNPRHWRAEVLPNSNIDLMMAGHTHALQTEICGYSPVVVRYPEWGGLYNEGEQYLYVNIGIGCTMTPTRLGATPEITLITLKSEAL